MTIATSRRRVERLESHRWAGGDIARLPDAELHALIRASALEQYGTKGAARAGCVRDFICDGMSVEDAEEIVREVFGPPLRT